MTAQRHTTGGPATGRAAGHTRAHTVTRGQARSRALTSAAAGALAVALLGIAPYAHAAGDDKGRSAPQPPTQGAMSAAGQVAEDDGTLKTLARFFARDGAVSARQAAPQIVGKAVPVYSLSAEFVAATADRAARTPVAELDLFASKAVSSDGQRASVMAARTGGDWRVVNIATGDDETRYAAMGAKKAPGGTVFQEPQIDAWYVLKGTRVLPLDQDARRAIGGDGTGLAAFHQRVRAAYADKLPGSAYDRKGLAGGFGPNGGGSQDGGDGGQSRTDGTSGTSGTSRNDGAGDTGRNAGSAAQTAATATGGQGEALGAVATTAGVGALVLGAAAGGTWLIRRRAGGARG